MLSGLRACLASNAVEAARHGRSPVHATKSVRARHLCPDSLPIATAHFASALYAVNELFMRNSSKLMALVLEASTTQPERENRCLCRFLAKKASRFKLIVKYGHITTIYCPVSAAYEAPAWPGLGLVTLTAWS
jgi:hypothetical protein